MIENPRVLIGISTGEYARRADFYDYVDYMEMLPGTARSWVHGQSPARSRNIIINQAIEGNFTHVLFLDDDMAFKPDLMKTLLSHDKDMVTGLYLGRNYPHKPMIFDYADEFGRCRYVFLNGHDSRLKKVVAAGLGACLIKTSVFEKMEKPYVRLGELDKDHWCDDIGFFLRAKAAGFELFCDLECYLGHIGTMIIWPNRNEQGDWFSAYDTNGTMKLQVPQPNPYTVSKKGIENALKIEGWMSETELRWLAETAEMCETIVEFGSHCGRSTRALADNCMGVTHAVDPWTGEYYNDDGSRAEFLGGSRLEDFKHNLQDLIPIGRVEYHKMKSTEFKLGVLADLVFIDGSHLYEDVKSDIAHAKTLVKKGGILAGHDYNDAGWPGVKRAVDEIFGVVPFVGSIWFVKV
jgi:methyltransferase family protein